MIEHAVQVRSRLLFFLLAAMLTLLAYWPGLNGPMLLDDFGNLSEVTAWLDGERSWQSAVFGNRSGPGGRPLAMASFVLDGALWGNNVWHFKLTNLLAHLGCGFFAWMLLRQLLARDPSLARRKEWVALGLALLWMSLPINASSVLYVVQRMAILAALFMFAGVWLYVVSRNAVERGDTRGWYGIFLGVPLLTALAYLCKENGLLLAALVLAVELSLFRPVAARPAPIRWLVIAGIIVPVAALALLLLLSPGYISGGYAMRDFTPVERLMTQPRILWEYAANIFVPYGPRLGLFHDNYIKSSGWLSPWTTVPAILAWVAAFFLSWRWRERHPAILAGLLFFFAGHALESSILGLELYFEHRNYLPSLGLLLSAAGLIAAALERMPARSALFNRALWCVVFLVPVVYLAATHGRALAWSSTDTLFAQELLHNPDSPRLRSFLTGFAIEAGDLPQALEHIDEGEKHSPPRMAMTTSLWRAIAYCGTGNAPSEDVYVELESRARGRIETFAMTAWEILAHRIESDTCPTIDIDRITRIGERMLEQPLLPRGYQQMWRTRYYLARLYAYQSRFPEAIAHAEKSWLDSDFNNGIGVFLFQINASVGNLQRCREIHAQLRKAYGGDFRLNEAIDTFGRVLQDGTLTEPDVQTAPAPLDASGQAG